MKKRILAIALAACLLLALLTACGGGDSRYAGKYYMSRIGEWTVKDYAELLGITEQEAREFMWLELRSGGKATFNSDGEGEEADWKVSGEKFTLSSGSEKLEGTIKDGVITFDMEGEILELKKD